MILVDVYSIFLYFVIVFQLLDCIYQCYWTHQNNIQIYSDEIDSDEEDDIRDEFGHTILQDFVDLEYPNLNRVIGKDLRPRNINA